MKYKDYSKQIKNMYSTKRWDRVKADVIERDHGICQRCHKPITERFIIHHTTPANLENFYDENILVLLCQKCHNYVTFHEGINKKLRKISLFGDAEDLVPNIDPKRH